MPSITQEARPTSTTTTITSPNLFSHSPSPKSFDKATVNNTFVFTNETDGDGGNVNSSSDFFGNGFRTGSLRTLPPNKAGMSPTREHIINGGDRDGEREWSYSKHKHFSGVPRRSTRDYNNDGYRENGVSVVERPLPNGAGATTDHPQSGITAKTTTHLQPNGISLPLRPRTPSSNVAAVKMNGDHSSSEGCASTDLTPPSSLVPSPEQPQYSDTELSQQQQQQQYNHLHNNHQQYKLQQEQINLQPANIASSPPLSDHLDFEPSISPSTPRASRSIHRPTLHVPKFPSSHSSTRDPAISNPNASPSEDNLTYNSDRLSSPSSGLRRTSLNLRLAPRSTHSDLHADEGPQDEEAARWTETIKQRRASKRKRRDEEDEDRVIVGTKVDQNHVNWVTAYNMLTGIRFTVSRTNAKLDRELTDADFEAKHKLSFDITGNELTPSAKYDFKFKDYAPWVFRRLRAKFQIDPADYLMSLTSKYILSELGSPGKSGSFFYFSRDYKYIIKTIHHGEHKLLRKVLREYYEHIENNPNTLISQFYGLHRVKMAYGRKIHFVVMNNLFPPHRDIHHMFDLKGSTIGRDFREEDLAENPRATLKDLNWLRRDRHLNCGPMKRDVFMAQLRRDVTLLQRLKIMDYSLLVGIHDVEKGNEEKLRDRTLQIFQPGGELDGDQQPSMLMRTPSRLESARKARELRQIIKREKPVPMERASAKMPDEILDERKNLVFYSDDGGFRATHESGAPDGEIYYLGMIDCLTHYGMVKKAEHFWKGLTQNRNEISPIPPEAYGERFLNFILGITKSKEEVEQEKQDKEQAEAETQPGEAELPSHERLSSSAEKEVAKSQRTLSTNPEPPDRVLRAVRSPSPEHAGPGGPATLPVVEEIGEASSTGGRSAQSTAGRDDANLSVEKDGSINGDTRRYTFRTDTSPSGPPPTLPPPPPKSDCGSISSGHGGVKAKGKSRDEKDLPPIPNDMSKGPPLDFFATSR